MVDWTAVHSAGQKEQQTVAHLVGQTAVLWAVDLAVSMAGHWVDHLESQMAVAKAVKMAEQ